MQVAARFRPQAAALRDLEALGLDVPAATLAASLQRLAADLFAPLDAAIGRRRQEAPVAHADETIWPVQCIEGPENGRDPPASGAKPRHYLWICLTEDTVRMRVLPARNCSPRRARTGPS